MHTQMVTRYSGLCIGGWKIDGIESRNERSGNETGDGEWYGPLKMAKVGVVLAGSQDDREC